MCGRGLLAAVSLALLLLLLRARAEDDAEDRGDLRMVGSQQVSIEARPYLLSLNLKEKGHLCDASLVAREWLLTAAHCVYESSKLGDPLNYFVVGGITDLTGCSDNPLACVDTTGAQIGRPTKFVVNPKYDVSKVVCNDLALIRLRRKMNLGKQVNIVALPTAVLNPAEMRSGTICSVTWWVEDSRDRMKKLLFAAQLPLLDIQKCSRILECDLKEDKHLCTFAPHVQTCRSDAGSPLVCDGIQVGVVTIDRPVQRKLCTEGIPGVYARLDTHTAWLHQVMSAAPPPPRPSVYWSLCLLHAINHVFT